MSEEDKPIRVVDRRMFTAEGELRPDFQAEEAPEPPKPAPAAAPPREAPKAGAEPGPPSADRCDVSVLRHPHQLSGDQRLPCPRDRPDDREGAVAPRLGRRQQMIEWLAVLEEKTRGSLNFEETGTCCPARSTSCAWHTSRRFGRRAESRLDRAASEPHAKSASRGRAPPGPVSLSACGPGLSYRAVPGGARSQEPLSPLPPPVTRGLYRSHWFDYLSAFSRTSRRARTRPSMRWCGPEGKSACAGFPISRERSVFLGRRAESQNHPSGRSGPMGRRSFSTTPIRMRSWRGSRSSSAHRRSAKR